MSNLPTITLDDLVEVIDHAGSVIKKNGYRETVIALGPTGIGKTSTGEAIAAIRREANPAYGLKVTEFSAWGTEDLKGFGRLNEKDMTTDFLVPRNLPNAERDGEFGLWVVDEIDKVGRLRDILRMIVTQGELENYTFPKGWQIVVMGNERAHGTKSDKIETNWFSACLSYNVIPSAEGWIAYDKAHGGSPYVQAFVKGNADLIYKFEKGDQAICTPRTWSKASEAVATITDNPKLLSMILGGAIGTGASTMLEAFLKLVASGQNFPTWNAIMADPMTAPVPDASSKFYTSLMFACITLVNNRASEIDHMPNVVSYLDRLPKDFAGAAMHGIAMKSAPEGAVDLLDCSAVTGWRSRNPDVILG
ncbi:MAG: ATP-binding protein [Alphaproteobacteria bacterium]|jgi:hypothetical protein|nr:ATP-binding protein [Alphaproteobacteria bacterium]